MVFEIGLASNLANIGALEEMRYGALKWWYPVAAEIVRARKKGAIL
jgi:hypothetical protein